MLHTIVIILVLATWARSLYVPPKFECKAHAGSAYWPDVPIWNRFYISIGGALLKPLPPAQSCYSGTSNQTDSEYCNRATESWFHSDFHGSDPLSVAYPNWQSDGCLPISLYDDPKDCNPEHFPKYVVNVSSASQVSETISFAVTHNVRLIVKGAGHDLLGRSTAPSVLSLWTRNLRGISQGHYVLSCQPHLGPYAVITAAAGHNMEEIYKEASKNNMTIVGGADPNVGVGGYITGGGHSPLGSSYGMAVDNVLEMTVVTPKGDIVVANECLNYNLYWAMRGGGGATFGVLINATIRTYPIPSNSFAMFGFNSSKLETSQDNPAYYHIISDVIADLPRLSSTGVSGYFHSMPIEGSSHYRMNFGFLVFVLNEQQSSLLQALEPTLALIERESSLDFSISTGHFSSYLDFQSNFLTAAPVGANRITVSRLWDKAAVIDKAGVVKVLRSFSNYVLQGTVVSGQGVSIRPANNNGLNPAWRHTAVHMSIHRSLEDNAMNVADELATVLRLQAPNMGSYVNEAHIREPEYQKAFWGENYDRSLEIKRFSDPYGVFWCPVCVGAEDWAVQDDATVCRVTT